MINKVPNLHQVTLNFALIIVRHCTKKLLKINFNIPEILIKEIFLDILGINSGLILKFGQLIKFSSVGDHFRTLYIKVKMDYIKIYLK